MRGPAMRTKRTRQIRSVSRRGTRPLQRDVLRDVMLSANECQTWLTLEELARLTCYPPASISAQLRHLRKPRHGGFRLSKRCRVRAESALSSVHALFGQGPVWEYRLERRRRPARRTAAATGGELWA